MLTRFCTTSLERTQKRIHANFKSTNALPYALSARVAPFLKRSCFIAVASFYNNNASSGFSKNNASSDEDHCKILEARQCTNQHFLFFRENREIIMVTIIHLLHDTLNHQERDKTPFELHRDET